MSTSTDNLNLKKPALSDRVIDTIGTDIPEAFDVLDKSPSIGEIKIYDRSDINPNFIYPGTTWTQLHDVFLVAAGSQFAGGSTGGSSEHKHVIPVGFDANQIYFHHDAAGVPAFGSETLMDGVYTEEVTYKEQGDLRQSYSKNESHLPPYRSVYMWVRTS